MKNIELIKIFANDCIGSVVLLGSTAYQYEGKNEDNSYRFLNTITLKIENFKFDEQSIWQKVLMF